MEMEMPTAEELEWLEMATAEEEAQEQQQQQEQEQEQEGGHFSPPPNPPNPNGARKMSSKREREEQDEEAAAGSTSKDQKEEEEEEEWLRYSPPPPPRPSKRERQLLKESEEQEEMEIRISRFASDIQGHCIPITGPRGHRVYAKLNPNTCSSSPTATANANAARLLPQSIHTLNQRVENNAFSKALQDSLESTGSDKAPRPEALQTEQLWVDKYAPSSFTELLSDEHTNREVSIALQAFLNEQSKPSIRILPLSY